MKVQPFFLTMKTILLFIALTSVICLNAQNTFTYYLMGRPFSIERNNALRTIGKENKINFEFAGNDLIELKGIEYFVDYNDSISKLISTSKLGENWLDNLFSKTDEEEKRQNEAREIVKGTKHYETWSHNLFEPIILIKKLHARKNVKYTVYVVGQLKEDEHRKFNTHLIFRYNKNKKKIMIKSQKIRPLPFTLPQNGLI